MLKLDRPTSLWVLNADGFGSKTVNATLLSSDNPGPQSRFRGHHVTEPLGPPQTRAFSDASMHLDEPRT
ncbi:hypothetical protein CGERO_03035 [Corynebacterium gerontici]|uniref:Uncharacterized protein n=1 Tax=Corynebacterium gerontici TaxID=2079234 RepID=A0A3G6J3E9_9CORY|nr:hypothetical protein CGERO_03035 [Corynebacterium gerontici]